VLSISRTSQFKKDYKRIAKRGNDVEKLFDAISILAEQKHLPERFRNHKLSGDYKDCLECHIQPDWLLIYLLTDTELVLIRTGTHADLFD
jgi:mRNA interferase YafQ